jgi:hypothetical protein
VFCQRTGWAGSDTPQWIILTSALLGSPLPDACRRGGRHPTRNQADFRRHRVRRCARGNSRPPHITSPRHPPRRTADAHASTMLCQPADSAPDRRRREPCSCCECRERHSMTLCSPSPYLQVTDSSVKVSFLELYNEELTDLLSVSGGGPHGAWALQRMACPQQESSPAGALTC